MKITFGILFLAILASACGSTPEHAGNAMPPNNTVSPSPSEVQISTPADTATVPEPASAAEKIAAPGSFRFEAGSLPDGWEWVDAGMKDNPSRYDTSGGKLKITVPQGKDLYGENRTAPRLLKAIEGDFQIETRVAFNPKENYQGAGLLIYVDGNTYLRLERSFGGFDSNRSGIRLDVRTPGGYESVSTPDDIPTDAGSVDLKFLRSGNLFIAFWRLDEEGEWKEAGAYDSAFPGVVKAGLIACNTGSTITAEFAYVKLDPAK